MVLINVISDCNCDCKLRQLHLAKAKANANAYAKATAATYFHNFIMRRIIEANFVMAGDGDGAGASINNDNAGDNRDSQRQ